MKEQGRLPGNAGHHAVYFYSDSERLCATVADFLADGLAARQPLVVIATEQHRRCITDELSRRRFNLEPLAASGRVLFLDAQETLARFMVNDKPDAVRFRQVVGEALDSVRATTSIDAVRAYGEMVDVLWRDGKQQEAIHLEMLWNDLARTHAFSLLCGYAMGPFSKEAGRDDRSPSQPDIVELHTHLHE